MNFSPRNTCRMLLLVAFASLGAGVSWAASDEDRIARLEHRILELEARLARAEKRGGAGTPRVAQVGSLRTSVVRQDQTAARSDAALPVGKINATPAGGPEPQPRTRDVTPSEFNVFRDSAATLSQNRAEAAIGFSYQKRSSALQSDRAGLAFTNFRYGLLDGVEFSLNVPYYYSTRSTQITASRFVNESLYGLGDISAQLSAIAIKETTDWPALVVSGNISAPTGKTPISFGKAFVIGGNPIDPFKSYQSLGDTSGGISAQVYKTIDPIIVFAGAGVQYALPQTVQGHNVLYQPQLTYNMGFAFAVNERTTIGFQVNGSYQTNFKIDGATAPGTLSEPILARMVVVQRIAPDTYIEPSVAVGISKDAPDAILGLTFRRRY